MHSPNMFLAKTEDIDCDAPNPIHGVKEHTNIEVERPRLC